MQKSTTITKENKTLNQESVTEKYSLFRKYKLFRHKENIKNERKNQKVSKFGGQCNK